MKKQNKKNEHIPDFNEAEANKNLNANEPTIEKIIKKRKEKTSRKQQFKNLEVEKVIFDLTEDEKTCDFCNTKMITIGSSTRETIKVLKKAIKVMEESVTYKCPNCGAFKKNTPPKLPIEGGIAKPSLIAQVIVDKMANSLPLYRQSEDYKRIGLNISRQTLSNWMIKGALLLEIIYLHIKKDLLSQNILHADETTVQVLNEAGKKASQKSYMWVYVSCFYDIQIAIYEYQSSRKGSNAKEFLSGFSGYLHVDGYKGYNQVENVTLVLCMAHLRRKFNDVYVLLPEDQKKSSNTATAMDYCNRIYSLDNKSKELPVEARFDYKQKYIKPLMEEFNTWLKEKETTCGNASGYGKAINYASYHLPKVMNYLEDGKLELDNNRAERAVK
ncbi:MAG: IS66 family transposase, partial [Bacteroidales bacterium]|nr:IS66 family transposase [Bacteroidales bacterium]